jgi:hypothetical protein
LNPLHIPLFFFSPIQIYAQSRKWDFQIKIIYAFLISHSHSSVRYYTEAVNNLDYWSTVSCDLFVG